jgi:hypothetical protein
MRGASAPPELGPHLASLLSLPADVRSTLSEVFEAFLVPVLDDRAETFLKRYARRYEFEPARLLPAAMAVRLLVTSAVKASVDSAAFAADVRLLVGEPGGTALLELLVPLFDAAYPRLREAAVFQSVAEHGRVVRAVRWRMDTIRASDHGLGLDVPVATITFQYQDGPNRGQASYQLLPEQALELKRALGFILE